MFSDKLFYVISNSNSRFKLNNKSLFNHTVLYLLSFGVTSGGRQRHFLKRRLGRLRPGSEKSPSKSDDKEFQRREAPAWRYGTRPVSKRSGDLLQKIILNND